MWDKKSFGSTSKLFNNAYQMLLILFCSLVPWLVVWQCLGDFLLHATCTLIDMASCTSWLSIIRQSMFQFHQFSSMNFKAQFKISWVGASLYSGDAVYVYVLMPENWWNWNIDCQIIDSQSVLVPCVCVCCCPCLPEPFSAGWVRRRKGGMVG